MIPDHLGQRIIQNGFVIGPASVLMYHLMQFVTDFGDQAVLLPLAVGVGLVLALLPWRRAALAWTVGIGGTYGFMLLLKLCFIACGALLPGHIVSPSGHTAAASAVYGALCALVIRLLTGQTGWTIPCALAIAILMGATRLALGVHTGLEVTIGGGIGVSGAVLATWFRGYPPHTLRMGRLIGVVVAVVLLFHGFRMPAEAAIYQIARNVWPLTICQR